MSNTFNINRFGKLFRKHTVENYKSYLMALVVLLGLLSVVYSFILYQQENTINHTERVIIFYAFLLLSGSIFTSTVFNQYGNRERAMSSITLPASQLEKFLVGWVYSGVLFILLFLACFYVLDILFLSVTQMPDEEKAPINLFTDDMLPYYAFYAYAFFNALCLYGAIAFKKVHFIKTGFAFFGILFLMVVLNRQLLNVFIPGEISAKVPFSGFLVQDKSGRYWGVSLEYERTREYIKYTFVGVAIFLWAATYFKLKEKQV